jgi:RHS repeat-associated protein
MKQSYFLFLFIISSFLVTAQTGISTEVGITEGELSVSLTGGATYSIPIAVPPGINGVVPQVGLVYNSQGGNGMAGYGWNISGVSSITRIPSTTFHDGSIDAVDFDSLDRFAFDGQRLMIKSGTYGANDAVYETENFSNVKITSIGVHPSGANYGPAYFKVEYPDGSKAYYGNSTDSRTITNWSITYWENPQGVRISYVYNNSNNNLNIVAIKYGTLGTITPINIVQFNYVTSKRPEQAYIGGLSILNNTILNNITVTGSSVGFRSYWLEYGDTTLNYQRLIRITEKSGDGTKSYNPTIFGYDDTEKTLSYNPQGGKVALGTTNITNSATLSGDFDGDGNMDFVVYPTTGTTAKTKFSIFTGLNSSSSTLNIGWEANVGKYEDIFATSLLTSNNQVSFNQFVTTVKVSPNVLGDMVFDTYRLTAYGVQLQYSKTISFPLIWQPDGCVVAQMVGYCGTKMTAKPFSKKYLSGDFNGDGLTDVLAIDYGTGTGSQCYTASTGSSGAICGLTNGSTLSKAVYFIDLNKNITSNLPVISGNLASAITSADPNIEVIDFNGDGKSDFMILEQGKVTVYGLDNNNQLIVLTTTIDNEITMPTYLNGKKREKIFLTGDYNGDGKTDFLMSKLDNSNHTSCFWYKYTSTGTSFLKEEMYYPLVNYPYQDIEYSYRMIPMDYDNDGKTDLVCLSFFQDRNPNTWSNPSIGNLKIAVVYNQNNNFSYTESVNNNALYLSNITGFDELALPIFYNNTTLNRKLEIACLQDSKIYYFQSTKDFSKEKLLRTITTGNSVKETITYKSLQKDNERDSSGMSLSVYQPASSVETYPNVNIQTAPTFKVVSKLEKQSVAVYKKQLFNYYGATSNMQGLGFLGFKQTARTNWYATSDNEIITSFSTFDTNRRGANTENYTKRYFGTANGSTAPADFITKSLITYNTATDALQANKVFKLKSTFSQQFNGLDGTSSETTTVLDTNNNPTQSKTIVKQAGVVQQTTISDLVYSPPTVTPYVIGRPTNKKQSVAVTGSTMTTEEQYTYTNSLLTDMKKFAGTDYISEHNDYDAYGNITQKIITYPGLTARKTNYVYDSTGRFLTKSTDIEGLTTTFVYNTDGSLKSETNPYNLTTTYFYDAWFKKIKTTDYLGKSVAFVYTRNGFNTTITTTGDDGSVSEELFDDLGRKTRSGSKGITGTFSYVDYLYDIYDRKVKVSEPYTTSATQWNESQFDVYGRLSKSISFTGKTVSMTYTGLVTKVDDGIKSKESTKNAIGNVVSMTDTPGGTINYTYFANGNLKNSEYGGVNTIIEQDVWGRKTKLIDPSAGEYVYTYNGFGETLTEKTPNGTTTYTPDPAVGKVKSKKITNAAGGNVSTTTYTYDSATKLLSSTLFKDDVDVNQITTTYVYDASKRLSSTTEVTPYATFVKQFTYDAYGRVLNETSNASANGKSSNKTIQHTYKNGQAWQLIDTFNSQVLWQTNTVNARGQLTTATLGNDIAVTNSYDTYGYITKMQHDLGSVNVMKHETTFDAARGNLLTRNNSFFGQKETFEYDSQDRLTIITTDNVLINNTFDTTSTEGYQAEAGFTISSSSGKLVAQGNGGGATIKKTFLTGATVGDVINLSFNFQQVQGADTFNIFIQEENPANGAVIKYLKKAAVSGSTLNTVTHTVTQFSTITLRIEKVNTIIALNVIILDNVLATKPQKLTQDYDERGRITKNNIGDYNYKDLDPQKVYRNTSVKVTPDALAYYNTRKDQIISYNVFKSPIQIEDVGIDKISFTYNDNNDRSAMFYGGLQDDKTLRQYKKYYSADGSMEIKVNSATPSVVEFVTYIGGDGYTAPIVVKSDGTTQNYLYLHRDYQGSILAITNQAGAVVEKRLFDAWGSIVKVQNGAGITLAGLTILDRGYTGHEHLQSVGLIHMNGRLYDPKLHRFLQPDNNIQEPYNTQNYNRYGYVLNNPLKYTDPSGEFWHIVIGAAIGGVINWATHGFQFNAKGLAYFGVGAAAGALTAMGAAGVSSALAGGSFTAGALGTSSAWACTATSSFFSGAVIGAAGGLAGGFASGVGNSLVEGQNIGKALGNGVRDGLFGALSGGVIGGIAGGIDAALDNRRFFDGATVVKQTPPPPYTLQNLQQTSDASCQATCGAIIDQSLGGNMSEMDVRNMMPGYDYTGAGAGDLPFWTEYTTKTGRYLQASAMSDDFSTNFFNAFNSNGGGVANTRIALSTSNHSLVLQSITKIDITKISGKVITKYLLNVMDPAYGAIRSYRPSSFINYFLIR